MPIPVVVMIAVLGTLFGSLVFRDAWKERNVDKLAVSLFVLLIGLSSTGWIACSWLNKTESWKMEMHPVAISYLSDGTTVTSVLVNNRLRPIGDYVPHDLDGNDWVVTWNKVSNNTCGILWFTEESKHYPYVVPNIPYQLPPGAVEVENE